MYRLLGRLMMLILLVSGCEIAGADPTFCMNPANAHTRWFSNESVMLGEPPFWGTASARRNDQTWPSDTLIAQIYAYSTPEFTTVDISLEMQNASGDFREQIRFGRIPKRVGLHTLSMALPLYDEPQWILAAYKDRSPHSLLYRLDDSQPNHISITSYNPGDCIITGTFNLTAIRDTSFAKTFPFLDTLRFTNGRFTTHLATWPYFGEGKPLSSPID